MSMELAGAHLARALRWRARVETCSAALRRAAVTRNAAQAGRLNEPNQGNPYRPIH
jgi:hypothetical protein